MMRGMAWSFMVLAGFVMGASTATAQQKIDLRTDGGVEAVKGEWRYSDVKLVETTATNAEAKGAKGYSIEPKAHGAEYDDGAWEVVEPASLAKPRAAGRVCFNWYRIKVTIPESAKGKKVFFQVISDDYGEVWVDGKLPRKLGQSGGAVVAGFNAPNRVELMDARPGKIYQVAVFGINGPISAMPSNAIFLREAIVEIR
jgi:gluconolactonase